MITLVLMLLAAVAQQDTGEEHSLCHKDFLRFWRVELVERDQYKVEHRAWSHWTLINDHSPEDKAEYQQARKFYMENKIKVEYAAIEGVLPK